MPSVYRLQDTKQIAGLRALDHKLSQLDLRLGGRTLSKAASQAMTPTVRRMRALAPVGKEWHKTYKGRWVGPGFLKRSIRKFGRFDRREGKATSAAGVRAEAYYGIQLLDQGPHLVTKRRYRGTGRRGRAIKPYTIKRQPWFESTFVRDVSGITERFRTILDAEITKALR